MLPDIDSLALFTRAAELNSLTKAAAASNKSLLLPQRGGHGLGDGAFDLAADAVAVDRAAAVDHGAHAVNGDRPRAGVDADLRDLADVLKDMPTERQ